MYSGSITQDSLIAAIAQAADGIIIADLDGKVQYVNPAFTTMTGYTWEEVSRQGMRILKSGKQSAAFYEDLWRTIRSNRIWRGELVNRRKDGTLYDEEMRITPVHGSTGEIVSYIVIKQDITQRREAEKARAFLAAIVESSENAVIASTPAGVILTWNRGAEALFGYTAVEIIGKHLSTLIAPECLPELEYFTGRLSQCIAVSQYESLCLHKDGRKIQVSVNGSPIVNSVGELVAMSAILYDITQRKLHEAELIRAREAADAANRTKSRFLANMSHEVRTPMNGVMGMVQLLGETDLTAKQREYVKVAQSSGRTLLALIDDILDLAKMETRKIVVEYQDFDLHSVMNEISAAWSVAAHAKGLAFNSQVSPETPTLVCGDPTRLRQVLNHLADNAIKFTAQGQMTLELTLVSKEDGSCVVRFAVADTGIGIRRDQIPSLFSPFEQADVSTTRKYGGSGLGLTICKQLVEIMGGEIGFDSWEGKGSTFWFTMLLRTAPERTLTVNIEAASAPLAAPTVSCMGFEERILIADDNSTNRMMALAQLGILGYQADTVDNGVQALEALEHRRYDLVLMDCEMPIMDGYEATRRIRKSNNPHIPIIAVTAHVLPADRERCLREGMSDFLSKPVDLAELAKTLAKWCLKPEPENYQCSSTRSPEQAMTIFDPKVLANGQRTDESCGIT